MVAKFIRAIRESLKMPPSEKEQLQQVICEHALSDFLKENPEYEVRWNHMPFVSYTLVDAKKLPNREEDEKRFLVYLHGEYEGTKERCYKLILNSMIEEGAIAKFETFDPKYPKIHNLFSQPKRDFGLRQERR